MQSIFLNSNTTNRVIDSANIDDNDTVIDHEKVEDTEKTPKRPKLYSVVLLNSDYVEFFSVILTLQQVFSVDETTAFKITQTAHHQGQFILLTTTKDMAETKASQAYQALCEFHKERGAEQPSEIFIVQEEDEED